MGEARRRHLGGLGPRSHQPNWTLLQVFLNAWNTNAESIGLPLGSCIAKSRIAAAVLDRLGYTTAPVSVWITVERTDRPVPRPVIGAHPIVPIFSMLVAAAAKVGWCGWVGHLVLRVAGAGGPWLVDAAAAQFSSPSDGIALNGPIAMPWPPVPPGGCAAWQCELRNLLVTYSLREDDAGDWRVVWDGTEVGEWPGALMGAIGREAQRR
jgi:hypothetical protein